MNPAPCERCQLHAAKCFLEAYNPVTKRQSTWHLCEDCQTWMYGIISMEILRRGQE